MYKVRHTHKHITFLHINIVVCVSIHAVQYGRQRQQPISFKDDINSRPAEEEDAGQN